MIEWSQCIKFGQKGTVIKMKKIWMMILTLTVCMVTLMGCSNSAGKTVSMQTATVGGMTLDYDENLWVYSEADSTDTSVVFRIGEECILGISCSMESTYQNGRDMVNMTKVFVETYEGYAEVKPVEAVEVNGETWYEWGYQFEESDITHKELRRCYGKNYYAYSIAYTATEDAYDKYLADAMAVLDTVKMNVPENTEAEAAAKAELVGEWDLADAGYLILKEDGTYQWFIDASKSADNMHCGTFACDTQIRAMNDTSGKALYLAIFPEKLVTDGIEGMTANAKYDYGFSAVDGEGGAREMINLSSFQLYTATKVQ